MALEERYIMQVTVDVPAEIEEEWNDWYSNVHIPEILACPGFINARRFKAVSGPGPRYTTIYEVENEHVRDTEECKRVRGWGKYTPYLIDLKVTFYKEFLSASSE